MRIVQADDKLGVTKVIWRFAAAPEAVKAETAPASPAEPEEDLSHMGPHEKTEATDRSEDEAETETAEPRQEPESPVTEAAQVIGHLEDLRQQIKFLQQVVEAQNQQLRTKDELIRNFQVLLKAEQDQVLRLETAQREVAPPADGQLPKAETGGLFGWLFGKHKG